MEQRDIGRQFGAMNKHIAAAVIPREETKTLGLVEEFNFARDAQWRPRIGCEEFVACCPVAIPGRRRNTAAPASVGRRRLSSSERMM
jgi:hypothetical protein